MIVGFFTAWPANRWLVRSGIKEKMDHRKHLAMIVERMREQRNVEAAADEPNRRERETAAGADENEPVEILRKPE